MAAVTINDQSEMLTGANLRAYNLTIAATGDTLTTPFTRIITVLITPNVTTGATTVYDYTVSGGTVTFNGAGTGFAAGEFGVLVVGLL